MVRWSDFPEKITDGVAADQVAILNSEEANPALKNQTMAYALLADSLAKLTNPSLIIHAKNQTDLEESILGTDLEVPAATAVTIEFDESFTLTKPFLLKIGSSLDLHSTVIQTTLTYTGTGALFRNEISFDPITSLFVRDLRINGDAGNSVFDLFGAGLVKLLDSTFFGFDSMGTLKMPFELFIGCSFDMLNVGLTLDDPAALAIIRCIVGVFSASEITFFSIITDLNAPNVLIDTVRAASGIAHEAMLFFDPNAPAGSIFAVRDSDAQAADLYQLGVDIAITGITPVLGTPEFTTASPHGLVVGRPVVLKDFTVETQYSGAFIVTAVDTPLTGTTFQVDLIFSGDDGTGVMSAKSKDSTDPQVVADNNEGSNDSMFIGGWFHNTNVASTAIADGTFNPLSLSTGIGVTPFVENERFSISVLNNGTIQYDGIPSITVNLLSVLSITKSGSTADYNLRYAIDRGSGFVALPTPIERAQSISSTSRDTTLNQEVILNTGDEIRIEIEGVGTTDFIVVIFGSLDIKR